MVPTSSSSPKKLLSPKSYSAALLTTSAISYPDQFWNAPGEQIIIWVYMEEFYALQRTISSTAKMKRMKVVVLGISLQSIFSNGNQTSVEGTESRKKNTTVTLFLLFSNSLHCLYLFVTNCFILFNELQLLLAQKAEGPEHGQRVISSS